MSLPMKKIKSGRHTQGNPEKRKDTQGYARKLRDIWQAGIIKIIFWDLSPLRAPTQGYVRNTQGYARTTQGPLRSHISADDRRKGENGSLAPRKDSTQGSTQGYARNTQGPRKDPRKEQKIFFY